jgi:outer membrane protein assembly factor BamB
MTKKVVNLISIAFLLIAMSVGLVYSQYPWPMFHHDNLRTGYTSSPGPNMNLTLWTYNTAHDLYGPCPSVVDGILYTSGGYGTSVYAINATTGAGIWNYTVSTWIVSSPAVADGRVYFGGFDRNVTAINATSGAFIWNSTTTGWVAASSPAIEAGVVYIGGGYGNAFYALNATDGSKIWNYTLSKNVHSSPALSGGMVYFGSFDHNVYALSTATGAKVWNYSTAGDVFSSPAIADGLVYIGSYDDNLYALNATTGAKIWNYTTGNWVASSPGVANGVVYVGSYDKNVYAFNASTGAKLWNYTTGGAISSSPAISSNGFVYIGSGDNKTYAFNAQTGAVVWTYKTNGDVFPSPAVVDGVVYAASRDGKVYAIRGSLQTSSIMVGSDTYPVTILSGSSLSNFQFSQSSAQISFDVVGPKSMSSFCNVTIPKILMQGPWTVEIDGSDLPFTIDENGDVIVLSFVYSHASTHSITILASWVVPEFPATSLMALLLATTLIIAILGRFLPKSQSKRYMVFPLQP